MSKQYDMPKKYRTSYRNKFYCMCYAILFSLICFLGVSVRLWQTNKTKVAPPPQQEQVQLDASVVTESPITTEYYSIPLSPEMQDFVKALCNKMDFNPATVYGIMYVESRFQNVTTDNIHIGLMQVNKNYFPQWVSTSTEYWSLTDREQHVENFKANVIGGVYALNACRVECLKRGYTQERDWLEVYNKGMTYFSMDPNDCTYANKVFNYIETLAPSENIPKEMNNIDS